MCKWLIWRTFRFVNFTVYSIILFHISYDHMHSRSSPGEWSMLKWRLKTGGDGRPLYVLYVNLYMNTYAKGPTNYTSKNILLNNNKFLLNGFQWGFVAASFLPRVCIHTLQAAIRSHIPWWRHQIETLSAKLALCAGNSPVPVKWFDVFFDLRLNKRLGKQPWGWRLGTPSWPLWRQCNVYQFRSCTLNLFNIIHTLQRSSILSN